MIDRWSINTLILYIAIIISATFFAWISQKNKKMVSIKVENREDISATKTEINYFFLSISFFILWFFMAFRTTGSDYESYKNLFMYANDLSYMYNSNIEFGFMLLCKFIRFFTSSEVVFFSIISFIVLFLVYSTILYFKDKIHIGMAIFVYSAMFYLQAYSLVRIYLASAIILYAFRYLAEKKYKTYILFIIIAMSIHVSVVLIMLPFFILILNKKNKFIIFLLLLIFVVVTLKSLPFLINLNISENYTPYLMNAKLDKIGIGQIAMHIPLILLFFYVNKYDLDKNIMHIFFIFILSSLAISMLGYGIPVIGRLTIYFTYPYVFFIPYVLKQLKYKTKKFNIVLIYSIIYISWRFYIYFSGYLYTDSIMPYTTIFNWQF